MISTIAYGITSLSMVLSQPQSWLYWVGSALVILLVLLGIRDQSRVETAVRGNRLGAFALLLAILITLWHEQVLQSEHFLWIFVAMIAGTLLGLLLAFRVKMIQMPETVGLLNGFGGLASLLAATLALINALENGSFGLYPRFTAGLAIVVGGLTWSGSAVAAAKLHKWLPQKPVIYPQHQVWTGLMLILSLASIVMIMVQPSLIWILAAILFGNLFGYLFSIRVGGADMPITISLLNSFSGVAGAIAGMAIHDSILVAVGGVVGASGLLLTQIMCQAMNRKLADILLGKSATVSAPSVKESVESAPDTLEPESQEKSDSIPTEAPAAEIAVEATSSPEESKSPVDQASAFLQEAQKIILVPGYGMALSQAQELVKTLVDGLEARGKNCGFAIHPVAGRMPGHMNVLLAEVDVPYEKLHEMSEINETFAETDLALVVGANDVINPAANTAEGTPIYGMPVLNVGDARHIIICNFDLKPGYAGVENPLYAEAQKSQERVALLLGDAKESLQQLIERL